MNAIPDTTPAAHTRHAAAAHKARRGMPRLWHAALHSLAGLHAGWHEKAFRLELFCAAALLPAAFFVGRNWMEVALLAASVVAVMVVELLNTAVESVVDRVGLQWHALSKRAKDLGSAAVLLATLTCAAIWIAALWVRLTA